MTFGLSGFWALVSALRAPGEKVGTGFSQNRRDHKKIRSLGDATLSPDDLDRISVGVKVSWTRRAPDYNTREFPGKVGTGFPSGNATNQ